MAAHEKALALAPRPPQITRHEAPDIFKVGELLANSGYFADAKDAAQAFVKVLAGRELGIGDIAAMTGIYIVKGKVSLSANLMAALVKRSGRYDYRVLRLDDRGCELEFYDGGQAVGRSAFTEEDARKAQLGGDNWKKFPRNMYFARAMSNGVKFYCPDVSTAPIYTPDELGAPVDGESGELATDEDIREAKQLVRRNLEASGYAEGAAEYIAERVVEPQPRVLADYTEDEPQDGAARRELLEQVVARCVALGYDTSKQLAARAKAAKMTDAKIKGEVIPSLDRMVESRHAEASRLRTAIYAEFARLEYSGDDIAEYMRKNAEFHGGTVLEEMSLEQLKAVASGLEIK